MSNDINRVIIVGRLTRDAELKYSPGGLPICKFSIASNTRKKSGESWVDEAHFFDVIYFGKGGEAITQYLTKGKQIAVDGSLRQNRWESDGQKHSRVEINAENVQLLGGGEAKPREEKPQAREVGRYTPAPRVPLEEGGSFVDDLPFNDSVPF